jgi:hypothetical protein
VHDLVALWETYEKEELAKAAWILLDYYGIPVAIKQFAKHKSFSTTSL